MRATAPALLIIFALLIACSDSAGPVPIADFDVSTSLSASPSTLVTTSGRWDGCSVTWVFTTNDSRPTVYYSVGPGMTSAAPNWWENGNFRSRVNVSLFVPAGRQIDYMLSRVEGTTEVWRKESGSISVSC